MPKLFRVMKKGDDQKPIVDATGKGLGVRGIPVNGVVDVDLDDEGFVALNGKGMSVVPAWRDLPFFLVPLRLKDQFPGARGAIDCYCFAMGHGTFQNGTIADGLHLQQDSPKHGNVVPQQRVVLDQFQIDLAATRESWNVDEE